jgi:glycosyltransferase involved in cell wall biosynthesis
VLCDASDDGTPEIARLLRPRNTQVLTVAGSIAAARQAGAEASHGDVLVFSDADVTFAPHYLERLAAVFCGETACVSAGEPAAICSN